MDDPPALQKTAMLMVSGSDLTGPLKSSVPFRRMLYGPDLKIRTPPPHGISPRVAYPRVRDLSFLLTALGFLNREKQTVLQRDDVFCALLLYSPPSCLPIFFQAFSPSGSKAFLLLPDTIEVVFRISVPDVLGEPPRHVSAQRCFSFFPPFPPSQP